MPSHAGPNIAAESNLVFALDTGDTSNSYRGEPTTNVLLNTNLDTGWSKDYQTNIIIGDPYPKPQGITSQAVSFTSPNSYGYWYSYGDYAPQADNTTYSVSVWARTIGNNFTIEPYTADNSESHRFWMPGKQVIGNGEWQRLTWNNAFTTPSNNDSDSLSFQLSSMSTNQRFWLLAPQLEPKSHVTPFVVGTRSATQGLLPLISNTSIDLSSVSFDSNAQIVYDGTDDYIPISTITLGNGSWTIECIVLANANSYNILSNSSGGPVTNAFGFYGNKIYYQNYDGSWQTHYGNTTLSFGTYYHFTWVNINNTMQMYVNGQTDSSIFNSYTTNGGPVDAIGRNWFSYFNGKLPIFKYYNTALSADQVKQNYQQYKTRFNLS